MARFGFVGPSYTSQSVNADCQTCMNWYVENNESGDGKSAKQLYPTPGLSLFATLPDMPVRGLYTINGRLFGVGGGQFCEVSSSGVVTDIGVVANDGLPASMCGSNTQILTASGQHGYVFNQSTSAFTTDPANLVSPKIVVNCDDFFVSLQANSNFFQYSTALDATAWNGGDKSAISVFPDNIVTMQVDHRELWFWGNKQATVYYDSGNTFTFDVISGAFIEQGAISATGSCKADNTVFWWSQSDRGSLIFFRANGYTPQRVSNHAIEFAIQGYTTASDVICYSYEDQGHTFIVSYFPTANKTWVYDVATQLWHERGYWDAGTASFMAHRSQCHAFAFGKHLVGDWDSGNIYQMAIPSYSGGVWSFATDFGNTLRRVRRAPHIANEAQRIFHAGLQIDLETGIGPIPALTDGAGNNRAPQVMLRWSDDGGHNWSNGRTLNAGQAGEYRARVIAAQLGGSRDRVYEMAVTDPIGWRVVDAYLDATGYALPTQRLTDKLKQQA